MNQSMEVENILLLHVKELRKSINELIFAKEKQDPILKSVQENLFNLQAIMTNATTKDIDNIHWHDIMDAGIDLYNVSRKITNTITDNNVYDRKELTYYLLLTRYRATQVMDLSLTGAKGLNKCFEISSPPSSTILDDYLDVIRSYGRVGSLFTKTAKSDLDRCQEYLNLSTEVFDRSNALWSSIGLSYILKYKRGQNLDEILQDVWDFTIERLQSTLLIMSNYMDENSIKKFTSRVLETLQELQSLFPYLPSWSNEVKAAVLSAMKHYQKLSLYTELYEIASEGLKLCDTLDRVRIDTVDNIQQNAEFKQTLLHQMILSLCEINDIKRAEDCFNRLLNKNDASVLFNMLKLYIRNEEFSQALNSLNMLFQLDDFPISLCGAKLYVEAQQFREDAMKIYENLQRNYGDQVMEIQIDLACTLAFSASKAQRAQALEKIQLIYKEISDCKDLDTEHLDNSKSRLLQTMFDVTQSAFNQCNFEECLEWANFGMKSVMTNVDIAIYMRLASYACLSLHQYDKALSFAQESYQKDLSKQSLLAVFRALTKSNEGSKTAKQKEIIMQIKRREDFEYQDLLIFGKVSHDSKDYNLTLYIMENVISILNDPEFNNEQQLPIAFEILLQNTAQIACNCINDDEEFESKFLDHVNILLNVCNMRTKTSDNLLQVYEWFYGICLKNGSCKGRAASLFYCSAAAIASLGVELFPNSKAFIGREKQCLAAAIANDMKYFDDLEPDDLRKTLQTINKFETCLTKKDEDEGLETNHVPQYVALVNLAIQSRLQYKNTPELFSYCKKHFTSAENFVSAGELVLLAMQFDEAEMVHKEYTSLAKDLFKSALQFMLQEENKTSLSFSYVMRRLITLSDRKEDKTAWLEQVLQIQQCNSDSLQVTELEWEWFVGKAWNLGIMHFRGKNICDGKKLADLSFRMLDHCLPLKKRIGSLLSDQYQNIMISWQS